MVDGLDVDRFRLVGCRASAGRHESELDEQEWRPLPVLRQHRLERDENTRPDRSRASHLLKLTELLKMRFSENLKSRMPRQKLSGSESNAQSSGGREFLLHLVQRTPAMHLRKRSIFLGPPKNPILPIPGPCLAIGSPTRSCYWHLSSHRPGCPILQIIGLLPSRNWPAKPTFIPK